MNSCKTCVHCPKWEEKTYLSWGLNSLFSRIFKKAPKIWKNEVNIILGRCRSSPTAPVIIDYGENQYFSDGVSVAYSDWGGGGYFVFKNEYGLTWDCTAYKSKE